MVLKIYNTLSRQKENFKPLKAKEVRMYACGPTVYDWPHIGNYRSFLFSDLIRRYLEYKGFKVKLIMNITDIDDKTIAGSEQEGVTLKEFTRKYEQIFFDGLKTLNIKPAFKYVRATETVPEMIKMTQALIKKGYAYGSAGSIYFSIKKFKNYGKLSKLDLKSLKIGARVEADLYAKEEPADFALMKKSTLAELKRGIYYDGPWGKVRPGWHIECSAISMKYLGPSFDIHTGGEDLIFPHHENEIAQSEAYTGRRFVKYWVHFRHLLVNGQKMSKSLGNYLTLRDLLQKGYDPKAIRYALLSAHYREQLNFTLKELDVAKLTVDKLIDFIDRLQEIRTRARYNATLSKKVAQAKKEFEEAMDDNLNLPRAMVVIFDLVKQTNKALAAGKASETNLKEIFKAMMSFDSVLGILEHEKIQLTKKQEQLIKRREVARKKGDFKKSDKIRAQLKEEGIILEDLAEGVRWRKA